MYVLGVFLFGICAAWLSRSFPSINPDEVIVAVNGENYLHGGGVRYTLNHDIMPDEALPVADTSNHVIRPLYDAWAGLWVLTGRGPWLARGSAVLIGVFLLVAFIFLGLRLRGERLALIFVFSLLTSPLFWLGSCVINEHGFLALIVTALVLVITRFPPTSMTSLIAGVVAGACLIVHQNIIPLFPGLVTLGFFFWPKQERFSLLMMLCLGFTGGGLAASLFVDLNRFIIFQKSLYWIFSKPMILDGSISGLIQSFWTRLVGSSTYYLSYEGPLPQGWDTAVKFHMGALGGALATGFLWKSEIKGQVDDGFFRAFIVAIIFVLVGFSLLVRRQEVLYFLVLFPFIFPAVGETLMGNKTTLFSRGLSMFFLSLGFTASVFFNASFIGKYVRSVKPYLSLAKEVKGLIHPYVGKRIVGPSILWFVFSESQFRDVGALNYARYFTDGRFEPGRWMSAWRPDYLIIENSFRRASSKSGVENPVHPFSVPYKRLGRVDTGKAYGIFDVLQLNWAIDPSPTEGLRATKKSTS
jgi:hypothetical protein